MMSHEKPRINSLNKTLADIIMTLADGNPDALSVMTKLCQTASKIDPDSAWGALGPLISLDNLDCYGPRIWMFYKDVCGQDVHKMSGVMRACQMGLISDSDINKAIDGNRDAINLPAVLTKLKARLPRFQIEPVET